MACYAGSTGVWLVSCSTMQLHIPDPAYTSSERARANFRLAFKIALGFFALIWLIQLWNWGLDLGLARFGVRPREWDRLFGILFAPLLHSGFAARIGADLAKRGQIHQCGRDQGGIAVRRMEKTI